jgi:arylsulfatase
VQAKQWLNEPIQQLLGEHIQSLMAYPPLQKAASFDFSALIDQMMKGKE